MARDLSLPAAGSRRPLPPGALWVGLAAVVLVLVVAGLPDAYRGHPAICAAGRAGCEPIDAADRADLADAGIAPEVVAAYDGVAIPAGTILAFGGVAAVIVVRRRHDRFAVFTANTLLLFGAVAVGGPTEDLAAAHHAFAVPVHLLELAGQVAFAALFYRFPDGRWSPGWTRWLLPPIIVLFAIDIFAPGSPADLFDGPLFLVYLATLVGAQVHRFRKVSDAVARQQAKWVCFGSCAAIGIFSVLLAVGFAVPALVESVIGATLLRTGMYAALALLPASIAVAILRYRLWDIDVVINRTLVWTTLSAAGLALYLVVVAVVGTVVPTGPGAPSLVAAAVVALAFAPLRSRIQVRANRMLYGERDDPQTVVSRLGRRLEATLEPDAVARTIVETIHDALRVPYVALLAVGSDGEPIEISATGTPTAETTSVPLTYGGVEVGSLRVGPRPGDRVLGRSDHRVLADLSRHAGLAVHALRLLDEAQGLSADLLRSRQQIVTAREEERRRLRRDLHDGLGPQLASVALKAEVVRDMLPPDDATSVDLLDQISAQAEASVIEVRRLVDGLRPPALDDLELLGAIRAAAAPLEAGGIAVTVDGPEPMPPLPAAVEVAAYRIAQEALHNALRHSGATAVRVQLRRVGGVLEVSVADDGRGLAGRGDGGVGLLSMRERASELGGSFEVVGTDHGAHLRAHLPVEAL